MSRYKLEMSDSHSPMKSESESEPETKENPDSPTKKRKLYDPMEESPEEKVAVVVPPPILTRMEMFNFLKVREFPNAPHTAALCSEINDACGKCIGQVIHACLQQPKANFGQMIAAVDAMQTVRSAAYNAIAIAVIEQSDKRA